MAMNKGIEEGHIIKMAALGRRFKLGDLYHYHQDKFVEDGQQWRDSFDLTKATKVEKKCKMKLNLVDPDSNKWEEHMNLDEHTQASVLAGFIDDYRGASKYLEDRWKPNNITRTLVCRLKSRKEYLNLQSLVPKSGQVNPNPEATHVVVGIIYGADAYYVASEDLDEGVASPNYREKYENLTKFMIQLKASLKNENRLCDFKEELVREKVRQLDRLKCRLYADLQTPTHHHCKRGIYDAYRDCLQLIEEIVEKKDEDNKTIPVTVFLSPLKGTGSPLAKLNYNIPSCRVEYGYLIMKDLERNSAKAKAFYQETKGSNRQTLSQFRDTAAKFQGLVRTSWKRSVLDARGEANFEDKEFENVLDIVYDHKIFQPFKLEEWLTFKKYELDMEAKLANIRGTTFFANANQMRDKLADSYGDGIKKNTLVLNVPSLDEWTSEFLEAMKNCVEMHEELVAVCSCEAQNKFPWQTDRSKLKEVMGKIHELTYYIDKNKHLESTVQFFITYSKNFEFSCHYSIYQGNEPFLDNLIRLPGTPTSLRIRASPNGSKRSKGLTTPVHVEWNYIDLGLIPCHFLAQYRLKGASADSWAEQKTTKFGQTDIVISCKKGSSLEIRVAAETCIGRSEFSDVFHVDAPYDDDETESEQNHMKLKDMEIRKRMRHAMS